MSKQELASAQHSLAKHYGDPAAGTAITRHVMICAVSDKQKCCSREEGEEAWGFLKSRLKELGLVGPQRDESSPRGPGGGVQRTKAGCLQICAAISLWGKPAAEKRGIFWPLAMEFMTSMAEIPVWIISCGYTL